MSNLKIHWKGYPHHHLPRIRVSSRTSVRSRSKYFRSSQQAPVPLPNPALQQQPRKKRFQFRLRRRRVARSRASSYSSVSAALAKQQARVRAKQYIQAYGWDSTAADLASRISTRRNSATSRLSVAAAARSRRTHRKTAVQSISVLPSTDGAAHSVSRQQRIFQSKNRLYEVHGPSNPFINATCYKAAGHGSRLRSRETVSRPNTKQRFPSDNQDRCNDSNSDRNKREKNKDLVQGSLGPAITPASPVRDSTRIFTASKPKDYFADPDFWEAVDNLVKQQPKGVTSPSINSAVRTFLSDEQSRTPSQRKTLRRFTRELELYLQATRALLKKNLAVSPSTTTISANTIEELMPYQLQFKSAGLAVTSEEQRGAVFPKKSLEKGKVEMPANKNEKSFSASSSTKTTVLEFLPGYEKFYDVNRKAVSRSNSIFNHADSKSTLFYDAPLQSATSTAKPRKKNHLPWLRDPNISSEQWQGSKKPARATITKPEIFSRDPRLPAKPPKLESFHSHNIPEPKPQVETSCNEQKQSSTRQIWPKERSCTGITTEGTAANPKHPTFIGKGIEDTLASESRTCQIRPIYSHTGTQTEDAPEQISSAQSDNGHFNNLPSLTSSIQAHATSSQSNQFEDECKLQDRGSTILLTKIPQPFIPHGHSLNSSMRTSNVKKGNHKYENTYSSSDSSDRSSFTSSSAITQAARPQYLRRTEDQYGFVNMPVGKSCSLTHNDKRSFLSPQNQAPLPPKCIQCECDPRPTTKDSTLQVELGRNTPFHERLASKLNNDAGFHLFQEEEPRDICTSRSPPQCQQCFPSRLSSISHSLARPQAPVQINRARESTTSVDSAESNLVPGFHSPSTAKSGPKTSQGPPFYSGDKATRSVIVAELTQDKGYGSIVADRPKGPSLQKLKPQPAQLPDTSPRRSKYSSTETYQKTLPPIPQAPVLFTYQTPFAGLVSTATSLHTRIPECAINSDKSVLRGLHVATAAACNEDIDNWVEDITGVGVRTFLTQLSSFEGLSVSTLAGVTKQAKRKDKMRA